MTFLHKGLVRSGETAPCLPKLTTMGITVGALLLGMGPHIRRLNRKCHYLWGGGGVRRIAEIVFSSLSVKLCRFC